MNLGQPLGIGLFVMGVLIMVFGVVVRHTSATKDESVTLQQIIASHESIEASNKVIIDALKETIQLCQKENTQLRDIISSNERTIEHLRAQVRLLRGPS